MALPMDKKKLWRILEKYKLLHVEGKRGTPATALRGKRRPKPMHVLSMLPWNSKSIGRSLIVISGHYVFQLPTTKWQRDAGVK